MTNLVYTPPPAYTGGARSGGRGEVARAAMERLTQERRESFSALTAAEALLANHEFGGARDADLRTIASELNIPPGRLPATWMPPADNERFISSLGGEQRVWRDTCIVAEGGFPPSRFLRDRQRCASDFCQATYVRWPTFCLQAAAMSRLVGLYLLGRRKRLTLRTDISIERTKEALSWRLDPWTEARIREDFEVIPGASKTTRVAGPPRTKAS